MSAAIALPFAPILTKQIFKGVSIIILILTVLKLAKHRQNKTSCIAI
jgi:hypothetical protein